MTACTQFMCSSKYPVQ